MCVYLPTCTHWQARQESWIAWEWRISWTSSMDSSTRSNASAPTLLWTSTASGPAYRRRISPLTLRSTGDGKPLAEKPVWLDELRGSAPRTLIANENAPCVWPIFFSFWTGRKRSVSTHRVYILLFIYSFIVWPQTILDISILSRACGHRPFPRPQRRPTSQANVEHEAGPGSLQVHVLHVAPPLGKPTVMSQRRGTLPLK